MVANEERINGYQSLRYDTAGEFYHAITELTRNVEAHSVGTARVALFLRDNIEYLPTMDEPVRIDMQKLQQMVITHCQDFDRDEVLIKLFNSALPVEKIK